MADNDELLGLPLEQQRQLLAQLRIPPPMVAQRGGLPMPNLPSQPALAPQTPQDQQQALGQPFPMRVPESGAASHERMIAAPQANGGAIPQLPVETPQTVQQRTAGNIPQPLSNRQKLGQLETSEPGVNQIGNPILRGIAKVGDVAATIFPRIGEAIPGTTAHHNMLIGQQEGLLNQDVMRQQKEAETANLNAEAEARQHPKPELQMTDAGLVRVPQEGEATPVTMAGQALQKPEAAQKSTFHAMPDGSVVELAKDGNGKTTANIVYQGDPKVQTEVVNQEIGGVPHNVIINKATGETIKDLGRKGHEETREPREKSQLAVGPDGTVMELRPGMKVPEGSKTVTGDLMGNKPSADEIRRADLSRNMNENLDQFEDILNRRPELFGKVAGRVTAAKQVVGTDDPDIAALKGIKEWFGMASVGAHAMRNAQHVIQAANAVFNDYHNSPEATKAAIQAARNSVQTFIGDVESKQPGARTPSEANKPSKAQGETTHFVEGKDRWDIPADKLERFKQLHPNAKAQ